MPFNKTTWVDGSEPAITAAQLNRIEAGIEDAHAGDLDPLSIDTAVIADGAVTTAKIGDSQVTTAKIGNGQVTTAKIGDGQVTTAKIGDGQVTNAKIASGIDASKLTTGTLPIARIADGAVTNAKIASGLDASKLTTGTLPIARIADGAITTAKTTATSANTAGAIVARDGSGNFAANSITAAADVFVHGNLRVGRGGNSRFDNTAVGASTLASNTTGDENTATGRNALLNNTTGGLNTATGRNALFSNMGGSGNTATGRSALSANTGGGNNSAFGYLALPDNTTGTNNIGIGVTAGGFFTPFRVTTESNRIIVGNNDHTHAYVRIAWTVTSDERDKMNFKPVPHGLDFVTKLKPVAFQFKKSRDEDEPHGPVHYGFKAQDVLKLEGKNPVMIDTEDPEHLKYHGESLVPVLVRAIQELKAEVDQLKSTCQCANKESA